MSISSILNKAIFGAEKGLRDARDVSSQLAAATPDPDESAAPSGARVEKAQDADLGRIVDEQA